MCTKPVDRHYKINLMNLTDIENQIIADYAEAYSNLGYSSLMGKIVALLIISPKALSLDEISERLEMSKGPVSQIARRLKEHKLIERVWIPGDRKDYYKCTGDIFGQAFQNYSRSMMHNRAIAQKFIRMADESGNTDATYLRDRMTEMEQFYTEMGRHFQEFLAAWKEIHASMPAAAEPAGERLPLGE